VRRIHGVHAFQELHRSRHVARSDILVVRWSSGTPDQPAALAFAIGRKVGNAVVRNRIRRVLRHHLDSLLAERHGDFLVIVTPDATAKTPAELRQRLTELVNKLP